MGYPADCTGCLNHTDPSLVVELGELPEVMSNKTDASGRKLSGCASWCQWVPAASQEYVAACETCERQARPVAAAGDRCASWCDWVPVPAQQYPADCTGCLNDNDEHPSFAVDLEERPEVMSNSSDASVSVGGKKSLRGSTAFLP